MFFFHFHVPTRTHGHTSHILIPFICHFALVTQLKRGENRAERRKRKEAREKKEKEKATKKDDKEKVHKCTHYMQRCGTEEEGEESNRGKKGNRERDRRQRTSYTNFECT